MIELFVITVIVTEKTIESVRSRESEQAYNLVVNNCEHFAIWCKTEIQESYQVKRVIRKLITGRLPI